MRLREGEGRSSSRWASRAGVDVGEARVPSSSSGGGRGGHSGRWAAWAGLVRAADWAAPAEAAQEGAEQASRLMGRAAPLRAQRAPRSREQVRRQRALGSRGSREPGSVRCDPLMPGHSLPPGAWGGSAGGLQRAGVPEPHYPGRVLPLMWTPVACSRMWTPHLKPGWHAAPSRELRGAEVRGAW